MKKLIYFELRKIFSKRLSMVTLIGILLFSALLSFSTYQNKYAFDQNAGEGSGKAAVEIDKEIAAKYEGILTDEKVRQMMSDFAPTSDLHGLNAAYIYQNAMQSAAFSRFSDLNGNWNGLSVSDVFGNEEIKIGYVDGWLSTSKNMVRVFIALALAVIIMLAPIFSGEYEGVDNIILTSKYGKTKCATAKVVAGILTAILTTALIVAFNLFLARAFYGTEGLNCSILFAPSEYVEAFIPFNITCGTLLKYQILLAFTCTISVTGITLLMSAISKNQIVALVAAMAIFLFPVLLPIPETNPLFRLVGLLPAPQHDPETARIRRALRAQKARRRKKMRSRRLFLLGMALILLFVLVPNLWGRAERLLYPRKYEALVDQWAETYGLDPLLVDAFIRTESGFDPQATSTVDARGLMQMTEETFIWLRSKIAPDEELLFANLYDPETSIRFGCYYLHLCMERYNGDVATAAAAYHSGWGTVDALLQMEEHSADGETLQGFPYNQMNHYVKKITSCYARYQRIYAES